MKNNLKKIALVLCTSLLLTGCGNAGSGDSSSAGNSQNSAGSYKVSEKTVPMYLYSMDKSEDVTLYFINDGNVPYISVKTIADALGEKKFSLEYDDAKSHAIVRNANGHYSANMDFVNDTITFNDYDAFFMEEGGALVDIGNLGNMELSKKIDFLTNDRYGHEMVFDLKKYDIDLVKSGDGYYIPLQTASDLFFSYKYFYALYNGEAVFLTENLEEKMEAEYYKASTADTIPEDLALFSYKELCLALDILYGLKETHNISNFESFIEEEGLNKNLKSTNVIDKDKALYELITCYLDDLHSAFGSPSYLTDKAAFTKKVEGIYGPSSYNFREDGRSFREARTKVFPDGFLPYQEIGDTAYITFDLFSDPSKSIDYKSEPKEEELGDTIRLMQYSCDKILRPGSPIKNVVMDLSLNTGGDCASASYVIGTFLGTGHMHTINTLTGATTTSSYYIDTNRDGLFDNKDTLRGKGLNLYCLISPVSFSCGNLVPNVFMYSPYVTLLGMTSGGGSCTVQPLSTAYGTVISISGSRRMSVFKNGSFYDIDRGAQPDYKISRIEDFYDRNKLTNFINGLI